MFGTDNESAVNVRQSESDSEENMNNHNYYV